MAYDRRQVILVLIRQGARSGKHFDNADEAQEEEYHPNDLITLKQIPYLHILREIIDLRLNDLLFRDSEPVP